MIDLWEINLNTMVVSSAWCDWWRWLSEDERDRADRYRQPRDRQQFVMARGLLRQRLGEYLGYAPAALRFCYGPHGKPEIDPSLRTDRPFWFNTSHSGGVALLAFSWDGAIGVDLEKPRSMSDPQILKLAQRFFLTPEVQALEQVSGTARSTLFFRYWTCKEARVKATGIGLAQLAQTPIVWQADQQPEPITDATGEISFLQTLTLRCGYPAAIAAIGHPPIVRSWVYPDNGMP
ncbi:MAG: 4'-phosphopantetheinyl transferase superfamily protein [Oscillatoriales cyanobacterium]|nr:MAG: 4'-phosphopantetheinyl transferase superfamily protein [Oscillatoriales cyanobacterium]